MIRTQTQLTSEQAAALKEVARERGVPVAELIRQGVEMLLAARDEPSREERKRRALAAVGRFAGGETDVSRRHDDYFVEAIQDRVDKRRGE